MTKRVTGSQAQDRRAILKFLHQLEADPIEVFTEKRRMFTEKRRILGDRAVAFIERFGRQWTYAPLSPDIPRGPENHCYANARALALAPSLSYVEGIGHAWCVDSAGTVIDNTHPADLPNYEPYFGVAFDILAVCGVKVRVGFYEGVVGTIDWKFPRLIDELPTILDRRWHAPA